MLNRQDLCRYAPELLDRQCRPFQSNLVRKMSIFRTPFYLPIASDSRLSLLSGKTAAIHGLAFRQRASRPARCFSSAVTPSAPPSLPQAIQSQIKDGYIAISATPV